MTNIKDKITGLQHVGIPTQRLRDSIDFYECLGFERIHSVESGADHPTVVFMQLNNLMIELYEEGSEAQGGGSIDHIALNVKEIRSLWEMMKEKGVKMITDDIAYLPFWEHGIRYFMVEGVNGEKVEFCERLKSEESY